jgi:hypothetical protein
LKFFLRFGKEVRTSALASEAKKKKPGKEFPPYFFGAGK